MRLMEVDEAANHIRELVDPDANIIWGSAFNPNLDGRIRVSVVATGIDSDGSRSSSAPAPSFAMSSPARKSEEVPAAPSFASSIASDESEEGSVQESDSAFEPEPSAEAEPQAPATPVATYGDDDDLSATPSFASLTPGIAAADSTPEEDELVLGDDAIQRDDEQEAPASTAASPAPRVATGGGTLFERMSNLTRGGSKSDEADDGEDDKARDPLDIPRFLNRQNNQ
jgi:cell division protein FtsZ